MSHTLIVDWLGRGGIAQCTSALCEVVDSTSSTWSVVTVAERELVGDGVIGVPAMGNRLSRHHALARAAAETVRQQRPSTVIIQNYVIPPLERAVVIAAREVGSRLVVVVHDHRLHSVFAGTSVGLRRELAAADVVLAHSRFVAERLPVASGTDLRVLPLPVPPEFRSTGGEKSVIDIDSSELLGLHFGVLKRRYKGTEVVEQLARERVTGWRFAVVGVRAPTGVDGLAAVPRFVTSDELVATVDASDAVLLPYTHASQSAAVTLAQSRGTVPVASDVGGLGEQIEHGESGLLVPADAPLNEWRHALEQLGDAAERHRMSAACRERADRDQLAFESGVRSIING